MRTLSGVQCKQSKLLVIIIKNVASGLMEINSGYWQSEHKKNHLFIYNIKKKTINHWTHVIKV